MPQFKRVDGASEENVILPTGRAVLTKLGVPFTVSDAEAKAGRFEGDGRFEPVATRGKGGDA